MISLVPRSKTCKLGQSGRPLALRSVLCSLTLAVFASVATPAIATDDFPTKPIRLVVGFAPGGGADVVARLLSAQVSNTIGQQMVVENRPGATGTIAATNVVRSPADGHALFLGSQSTMIIAPAMFPALSFNPLKDFTPVSQMVSMPLVLVTNPAVIKATTLAELTEELKTKNDGSNSYASSGQGGPQHIAGELYKKMANLDITHIPYQGESAALTNVLGGHVPYMFANLPIAQPHVASGALRALAITSLERSPKMPDTPTLTESGFKDFEVLTWYGVFAPAGTPTSTVSKLNGEILNALKDDGLRRKLDEQGFTIIGSNSADFQDLLNTETPRWAKFIQETGIQP